MARLPAASVCFCFSICFYFTKENKHETISSLCSSTAGWVRTARGAAWLQGITQREQIAPQQALGAFSSQHMAAQLRVMRALHWAVLMSAPQLPGVVKLEEWL